MAGRILIPIVTAFQSQGIKDAVGQLDKLGGKIKSTSLLGGGLARSLSVGAIGAGAIGAIGTGAIGAIGAIGGINLRRGVIFSCSCFPFGAFFGCGWVGNKFTQFFKCGHFLVDMF